MSQAVREAWILVMNRGGPATKSLSGARTGQTGEPGGLLGELPSAAGLNCGKLLRTVTELGHDIPLELRDDFGEVRLIVRHAFEEVLPFSPQVGELTFEPAN